MPPKRTKINTNREPAVAYTSKGAVQGLACSYNDGNNKYFKFLKVRYAQIPDGDLRFTNPEEITTSKDLNCGDSDVVDIKKNTKSIESKRKNKNYPTENEKQEDCLFVDIYTPELRPEKSNKHYTRPVIVFVPGFYPEDCETFYGGEFLMAEDVVLVVLFHRQDIFVIIKGFEFVKKEIRHFGGCPGNITAYGQGLSCAYIRWLTLDPYSGEYFHKMILSSSMEHSIKRDSQRYQYHLREVAKKIGSDEELDDDGGRALKWLENLKVVQKNNLLAVEGDLYGVQMPVLIGFNAMEGLNDSLHLHEPFSMVHCEWLLYLAQICSTYDEARAKAPSVMDFYHKHLNKTGRSHNNMCYEMIKTDISYVIGILHLATNLALDMDPRNVYLYKFSANLTLNCMKNVRRSYPGTAHRDELGYIFKCNGEERVQKNSAKGMIIKLMTGIWAQFARTGDPNPVDGFDPPWRPIGEQLTHYFEIDSKRGAYREFSDFEKVRFQFWERMYGIKLLPLPASETVEDTEEEEEDDFGKTAESGTNDSIEAAVDDSRMPTSLFTILPEEESEGQTSAHTGSKISSRMSSSKKSYHYICMCCDYRSKNKKPVLKHILRSRHIWNWRDVIWKMDDGRYRCSLCSVKYCSEDELQLDMVLHLCAQRTSQSKTGDEPEEGKGEEQKEKKEEETEEVREDYFDSSSRSDQEEYDGYYEQIIKEEEELEEELERIRKKELNYLRKALKRDFEKYGLDSIETNRAESRTG